MDASLRALRERQLRRLAEGRPAVVVPHRAAGGAVATAVGRRGRSVSTAAPPPPTGAAGVADEAALLEARLRFLRDARDNVGGGEAVCTAEGPTHDDRTGRRYWRLRSLDVHALCGRGDERRDSRGGRRDSDGDPQPQEIPPSPSNGVVPAMPAALLMVSPEQTPPRENTGRRVTRGDSIDITRPTSEDSPQIVPFARLHVSTRTPRPSLSLWSSGMSFEAAGADGEAWTEAWMSLLSRRKVSSDVWDMLDGMIFPIASGDKDVSEDRKEAIMRAMMGMSLSRRSMMLRHLQEFIDTSCVTTTRNP